MAADRADERAALDAGLTLEQVAEARAVIGNLSPEQEVALMDDWRGETCKHCRHRHTAHVRFLSSQPDECREVPSEHSLRSGNCGCSNWERWLWWEEV